MGGIYHCLESESVVGVSVTHSHVHKVYNHHGRLHLPPSPVPLRTEFPWTSHRDRVDGLGELFHRDLYRSETSHGPRSRSTS